LEKKKIKISDNVVKDADKDIKKEVSYEDNKISSEEFNELERKEGKKIKIKESEEEPKSRPPIKTAASDTDLLLLKTEKMEGRIESITETNKAIEERMSNLNQEIGELRSSIMERDRSIKEFQGGFARIKEIADGMEPEKIAAELAKKDELIEKNAAMLESLDLKVKEIRKGIKSNANVLEDFRDMKNLMKLIQSLKEKVGKVEDDKKFTSRTAAKIETMFSDLGNKLAEFQLYKDKIAFNEETMHEIMKTVDAIETRVQEIVKKDDIKRMEDSIDERFGTVNTAIDDKVYDVKKLLDELLTGLKNAGIKGVLESTGRSKLEEMFATKNDVDELKAKLDVLREKTTNVAADKQKEFMKQIAAKKSGKKLIPDAPFKEEPKPKAAPVNQRGTVMEIKKNIDSMLDRAENSIRIGNMDAAKSMYKEALMMYNQLNHAHNYQDAAEIYERITHLYSRLRIYS
jgi:chromosome segregation ATPase